VRIASDLEYCNEEPFALLTNYVTLRSEACIELHRTVHCCDVEYFTSLQLLYTVFPWEMSFRQTSVLLF